MSWWRGYNTEFHVRALKYLNTEQKQTQSPTDLRILSKTLLL